jgi:hypothetical protein
MPLSRVRDEARTLELAIHCGGLDLCREMDIRIAADKSGDAVLFSSRLRSEEKRDLP